MRLIIASLLILILLVSGCSLGDKKYCEKPDECGFIQKDTGLECVNIKYADQDIKAYDVWCFCNVDSNECQIKGSN